MAVKIPEKTKKREPQKQKQGLRVNYLIIFLSGLLILIGGIFILEYSNTATVEIELP